MQLNGSIHYCPKTPLPRPLEVRSKGQIQLFQNMVMLQIIIKGMMHAVAWCQILTSGNTPSRTQVVGSKGKNFKNMVMLHIKLNVMTHAATW